MATRKRHLKPIAALACSLALCTSMLPATAFAEGEDEGSSSNGEVMLRVYNPNSGEHFYTSSKTECDSILDAGWQYEGVGWTAPSSGIQVYRLYNAVGGEHHYTTDAAERDALVAAGWTWEDGGWYSDESESVPLYRAYNPNAFANNHNYTADYNEHSTLLGLGWIDEGVGWYGIDTNKSNSAQPGDSDQQDMPWSNVKVIVPDTIGDYRTPANRMKITNYSFGEDGPSYYKMYVEFECTKIGEPAISNWGHNVNYRDNDGNIIKQGYLFTYNTSLNGKYTDDLSIPLNTAVIEFLESPEATKPGNPGEDEVNSSDVSYALDCSLKASQYANSAAKYANDIYGNRTLAYINYTRSSQNIEYCKQQLDSVRRSFSEHPELEDFFGTEWQSKISDAYDAIDKFNGIVVDNTSSGTSSAYDQAIEIASAANDVATKALALASTLTNREGA